MEASQESGVERPVFVEKAAEAGCDSSEVRGQQVECSFSERVHGTRDPGN